MDEPNLKHDRPPSDAPPIGVTFGATNEKLVIAQTLRRRQTPAEAKVWQWLRARCLCGWKFRRQQVILGFVADFYCAELLLVIELDGGIHDSAESQAYDQGRDAALLARGITTLRFPNEIANVDEILQRIVAAGLTAASPRTAEPSDPLPTGRGL